MSSDAIYIKRGIIDSKAFKELKGNDLKVLIIFLSKRKMCKKSVGREKEWIVENNGEIVFTYREAQKRHGLAKMCFTRAIDHLIELGFLDIEEKGNGFLKGATTKYRLVRMGADPGEIPGFAFPCKRIY